MSNDFLSLFIILELPVDTENNFVGCMEDGKSIILCIIDLVLGVISGVLAIKDEDCNSWDLIGVNTWMVSWGLSDIANGEFIFYGEQFVGDDSFLFVTTTHGLNGGKICLFLYVVFGKVTRKMSSSTAVNNWGIEDLFKLCLLELVKSFSTKWCSQIHFLYKSASSRCNKSVFPKKLNKYL